MGENGIVSDLHSELTDDQIFLLCTIAQPYVNAGTWPSWYYVQHQLDSRDLDAQQIIKSLPRVGFTGLTGPSYGFTPAPQHHIAEADTIRLTVAAALPVPELRPLIADPFILVLHEMIARLLQSAPTPTESARPRLEAVELGLTIRDLPPGFLAGLPDILGGEPATWAGSSSRTPGGSWTRDISREVLKYRQATDLQEYVARVSEIIASWGVHTVALNAPASAMGQLDQLTAPLESEATYVRLDLIGELEELDSACRWSLDKLASLARELNSNYAADQPYACHMLLRATLDHMPPVFGYTTFAQVVANHRWSTTDVRYAKKLTEYRNPSDDVLHRQIRSSPSRIDMDDLPPRPYINAVLQEFLSVLQTSNETSATP
ncbi:hypothetical protein Aple_021950 [Acrocarpospora pleiomorpha]|uniref:Uncharacterized protein n=1 Tax=Acrocarpospora pleiomorpha TaxID=90975 RepID=A0A5M3XGM8_9ACTN|nr:hypothetical protein [Acrocarpospora pleiomorpha]GES19299.1 hypothetical protein Aple_021950 [Acrocarpospora pleiomorpha]